MNFLKNLNSLKSEANLALRSSYLCLLKIHITFLMEHFINKWMTFGCGFSEWVCFHEFYIIFSCEDKFGHFLPEELLVHFSILERLFNILLLFPDFMTLFQRHLTFYSSRDQIGGLSLMPRCLTTGKIFRHLQI